MTIEIREVFAWKKPGASSVAIHCVPPPGFTKASQGFRVKRDGVTLWPSCKPFATYAEAEAAANALEAKQRPAKPL